MNPFDMIVLLILAASIWLGYFRGFVYELLSMFGWPIAYLMSQRFAADVATQLPSTLGLLLMPVTYAIIFVVTLIVWGLVILGFFKLVKAIGLGRVDKGLGIFFGLVRALIVSVGLTWFCGAATPFPEHPLWREAALSPLLEDLALNNKHYLPPELAQRIHYQDRR